MAAPTKAARTIQTSATNTAGSTTTSSAVDARTYFGTMITAKITNGGTGPTLPCVFKVEYSNDNIAWKTAGQFSGESTNSGVYEFTFLVPAEVMYYRTVFTGNTGQSVTVEAFGHEIQSIA